MDHLIVTVAVVGGGWLVPMIQSRAISWLQLMLMNLCKAYVFLFLLCISCLYVCSVEFIQHCSKSINITWLKKHVKIPENVSIYDSLFKYVKNLPDACWDMSFDILLSGCRSQAGVDQQTAVLPAAESRCFPRRAPWQGKLLPPASLPHHPLPAPSRLALGQAEGQRHGRTQPLSTVRFCWSKTTLTGWGLKQVAAMVTVGWTGSGEARQGQRRAAGRWHHRGKPGGPPVVLAPVRCQRMQVKGKYRLMSEKR